MAKMVNVKYLGFDDIFNYNGVRYQLKGMEYNGIKSFDVKLHAVNLDRNVTATLETVTSAQFMVVHKGVQ